jgi:hypothetical protein
MRDELRECPVHVLEVADAHSMRRDSELAHALSLECNLERDRERTARARRRSDDKYGSGDGSPASRARAGARNGLSASSVTIHGEIVVAKFLARNGPSGWYSHA